MSEQCFRLGGQIVDDPTSSASQAYLAAAYQRHERPRCQCTDPAPAMYIARSSGTFLIKRMPGTGMAHAPGCGSWLPPEELSGLGQVLGGAIADDPDDGSTALRLGFSLSKSAGRAAPTPSDTEPDSVATDGSKLSLRGLLHYLWDEAGLTTWSPAMTGRRNWRVISFHLRAAADGKSTKRQQLGEKLFIPEPFSADHKAQLSARRLSVWNSARPTPGKSTPLLLVVGEVKGIEPARYGHKIVVKHLPDAPLMVADDLHRRIGKRFGGELEQWSARDDAHLMMIATISIGRTGLASVEEISLMLTDGHWLPITDEYEHLLIETAVETHRRFRISLRYNLDASAPMAALVFTDTTPATAAYLTADTPPGPDPIATVAADNDLACWHWDTTTDMPDLPPTSPAPARRAAGAPR